MNKRLLIVALIFAIFTGILTISYMKSIESKRLKGFEMVTAVVTTTDVPARSLITQDMLEVTKIPKNFLQPGAFSTIEDVVGKVALVPLKAGSQVSSDMVVDISMVRGLSALIPTGYRAITLHVDAITGVGGHIVPGDIVDIYAVLEKESFSNVVRKPTVVVPFENILVLAVGQKLPVPTAAEVARKKSMAEELGAGGSASNITVAVPPDTAADLLMLQEYSEIVVVMKPLGEKDYIPLKPETIDDVLRKYLGKRRRIYRRVSSRYINVYDGLERSTYRVLSSGKVLKVSSKKIAAGSWSGGNSSMIPTSSIEGAMQKALANPRVQQMLQNPNVRSRLMNMLQNVGGGCHGPNCAH